MGSGGMNAARSTQRVEYGFGHNKSRTTFTYCGRVSVGRELRDGLEMLVFTFVHGCLVAGAMKYTVRELHRRGGHNITRDLSQHETLADAEAAIGIAGGQRSR